MENLLESNERTLDIFDSVCSGLANCLALVHADIRQMSEHREQLAQQLELELELNEKTLAADRRDIEYTETDLNYNSEESNKLAGDKSKVSNNVKGKDARNSKTTTARQLDKTNDATGDPLHLTHLKLLDKQLADSFSQALSMYDQRKSAVEVNTNQLASQKPSLFQVLLGRGGNSNKSDKQQRRGAKQQKEIAIDEVDQFQRMQLDSQAVIDDINRQTRLAMQYSKQLEAHLFKVEDLRSKYEMHLKMGLIVKSVSRAYLPSNPNSSSSLAAGQLINHHSVNSLGRSRGQHHSSSLLVNDRSSLGATTTTRSSMSSLNLSTWSFSRRQHSDRGSTANSRRNLPAGPVMANCLCQQSCGQNVDGYNSSSIGRNQKCASTISLDSISNKQRRLNLSKLISSSKIDTSAKHNNNHQAQDYYDPSIEHHNDECQCQMMKHHHHHTHHQHQNSNSPPLCHLDDTNHRAGSPTKQLNQYVYGATAEFATPTTTGTLAGGYVDANGVVVLGEQPNYRIGGGGVGSLHKSASHSSLKRGGRNFYKSSLGHSQHQLATNGSKTTIKEFIDNIERIEAEFESYMGTFLMNIEDIQGFARVCQGDVFEINIKYGDTQKFKTKISVLKENRQKCDNKQAMFKARIADVIAIKAYECKGLGKKVLLGHKLCETRDLFTAQSQLMTISLNQTGSIKLNLVITWNPLHMTPKNSDISHISLPPTPISSSTLSSLSSARSSTNCGLTSATKNVATSVISINQANNQIRSKMSHDHHQQQQSSGLCGHNHDDCCNRRPRDHSLSTHIVISSQNQKAKVYQDTESAYAYRLPEPDYLTTGELKY